MSSTAETQPAIQEDVLPKISEFPKKTILAFERETLGIYLSGHPLDDYAPLLKKIGTETVSDALNTDKHNDGDSVFIAACVSSIRIKATKSNSMMAYIILEGTASSIEGIVFPKVLDKYQNIAEDGAIIIVRGRISTREDSAPQLICDELHRISEYEHLNSSDDSDEKLYLRLPTENCQKAMAARAVASAFPGPLETIMYYEDTKKRIRTHISRDAIVFTRLKELLGAENVVKKGEKKSN